MLDTDTGIDGQDGGDLLDGLAFLAGELDVFGGGVELLVLARLEGEEDEAGLVCLEAFDVEFEGLFRGGLTAVVYGDADCGCEFAGNAGGLEGEIVNTLFVVDLADREVVKVTRLGGLSTHPVTICADLCIPSTLAG